MRPDDRFDFQIEADLAAAGVIARAAADQGPVPAFGTGLRSQLLTSYAHAGAVRVAPRRRRWSLRFAPVLATMFALVLATIVAAGVIRLMNPPAQPPRQTPAPPAVVIGVPGGEAYTPSPTPSPTPSATPSATPTPMPTPSPSPTPTPTPTATPTATPTPTPKPTPEPTAKPTAKPTKPSPTPTPIGAMSLSAAGCNGGVAVQWSPISDARFAKYRTLRSTSSSIPAVFPPQAGAVEVATAKSSSIGAASGYDAPAKPGTTLYYRTLALDGSGSVIAASGVASAAAKAVQALGPLVVAPDAGGTRFSWTPFTGSAGCFTYYKLVYTLDGSPPSYLDGDPYLLASGNQAQATYLSPDLESGKTYTVRLQVIRATDTGAFLVAQTNVATYAVP